MQDLEDSLMFLDDSIDTEHSNQAESLDVGCATFLVHLPLSTEHPRQLTLVVEAKPPTDPYPAMPWEVHVSLRFRLYRQYHYNDLIQNISQY